MEQNVSNIQHSDYDRIAQAISFIVNRVNDQPTLQDIAGHLNISPYHFQRLFRRWAGVTPKRFLQVLTLERAKQLLSESKSILEASNSLGLSSGSRLYDHFVHLEAVTPGEFKTRGAGLTIEYAVHDTPFGKVFIATTLRGICNIAFLENADMNEPLANLHDKWPRSILHENRESTLALVKAAFGEPAELSYPISLYLSGTNFEINVWKALLQVPPAMVVSYSQVARAIGHPNSARAVGLATAKNPVAFLIPCHRVIRQSGELGGYHWGNTRKHAIHSWESARYD